MTENLFLAVWFDPEYRYVWRRVEPLRGAVTYHLTILDEYDNLIMEMVLPLTAIHDLIALMQDYV